MDDKKIRHVLREFIRKVLIETYYQFKSDGVSIVVTYANVHKFVGHLEASLKETLTDVVKKIVRTLPKNIPNTIVFEFDEDNFDPEAEEKAPEDVKQHLHRPHVVRSTPPKEVSRPEIEYEIVGVDSKLTARLHMLLHTHFNEILNLFQKKYGNLPKKIKIIYEKKK